MGAIDFIREHPIATGAVAVGAGAFLLLGGGGSGQSVVDDGYIIGGVDPNVIAANNDLLIAQQQSADNRYAADLESRTRLAERAFMHQETQWDTDLRDRTDQRRFQEAVGLQSTQLAVVREQEQSIRHLATVEGTTRQRLGELEAQTSQYTARQQRKSSTTSGILGVVGSVLGAIFKI